MLNQSALCPWDNATYLLFSNNVPSLIYYTHVTALILSLLVGLFVYLNNRKNLTNKILFFSLVPFLLWVFFNIIIWASNRSDLIMFLWSLQIMLEPLTYIGMFYLLYVFVNKHDVSAKTKIVAFLAYLPLLAIIPTKFNLPAFDVSLCIPVESFYAYYSYVLEASSILGIALFATRKYQLEKSPDVRKQILYLALGVVLFLLAFASGNIFGSLTDDWVTSQYGLFGTPIFAALIAYLVVRYQVFNVKLIAAQALVIALWVLILSLLFLRQLDTIRIVTAATFLLSLLFGTLLVRSVHREIEHSQKIEKLASELQIANEGQSDLLHIINHQIKGYMTKARLIFDDLLSDPGYNLTEAAKPMVKQGYDSVTEGVDFVRDFLNASNIERGTFTYEMKPIDLKKIVTEQAEKQKSAAQEKGLSYELNIAEGDYSMTGDDAELDQAVRNLIDNSIKYTPRGGLSMKLERKGNAALLSIKDTGVGISDELKPKLFTKGGRDKDSQKINVNSTGFGLAFVKGVVEAHKGRVWAESPGPNKGSTFYMELPLNS